MDIADRLRQERERLGYSQADFSELGGVSKRSQINYESGARQPDASYLAEIARHGVDISYVLTGLRAFIPPPQISPREAVLLENYRALGDEARLAVEATCSALIARSKPKRGGVKARQVVVASRVGQALQVEGDLHNVGMNISMGGGRKKR